MAINKKYIFGASGHGKVVADSVKSADEIVVAFFDDIPKISNWNSIPIHHANSLPKASKTDEIVIAIGNNKIRKEISSRLIGFNFLISSLKFFLDALVEIMIIGYGNWYIIDKAVIVLPDPIEWYSTRPS
jgi:hypothetical protein